MEYKLNWTYASCQICIAAHVPRSVNSICTTVYTRTIRLSFLSCLLSIPRGKKIRLPSVQAGTSSSQSPPSSASSSSAAAKLSALYSEGTSQTRAMKKSERGRSLPYRFPSLMDAPSHAREVSFRRQPPHGSCGRSLLNPLQPLPPYQNTVVVAQKLAWRPL